MGINRDFRDLFSELRAADARFLVIGAHAVMFHALPRYTKDLDIWIEPSPSNGERPEHTSQPTALVHEAWLHSELSGRAADDA